MEDTRETYLQCPYCCHYKTGHGVRVPNTVGKYRIKRIYGNVLVFNCARCGRVFKMLSDGKMLLWSRMKPKEKTEFKNIQYRAYKEVQEQDEQKV